MRWAQEKKNLDKHAKFLSAILKNHEEAKQHIMEMAESGECGTEKFKTRINQYIVTQSVVEIMSGKNQN